MAANTSAAPATAPASCDGTVPGDQDIWVHNISEAVAWRKQRTARLHAKTRELLGSFAVHTQQARAFVSLLQSAGLTTQAAACEPDVAALEALCDQHRAYYAGAQTNGGPARAEFAAG
jgi:hypothetical protein